MSKRWPICRCRGGDRRCGLLGCVDFGAKHDLAHLRRPVELHLVAERKRVTFAVERTRLVPPSETGPVTPGPEGTERWSVTEVERKDAAGNKTVPKK